MAELAPALAPVAGAGAAGGGRNPGPPPRRRRPADAPAGWKGYGPGLARQVCDVLLARPEWAGAVLDALEQSKVRPTDIDAPHRQRLLQSRDKAVRAAGRQGFWPRWSTRTARR